MHPIEQQLHDRNLEAAWRLAGGWAPEHQDQLADLIVERFIRKPEREQERSAA